MPAHQRSTTYSPQVPGRYAPHPPEPAETGDETPPFSPGTPTAAGIGQQMLGWAQQFQQCIDLMHGRKHAGLSKHSRVLVALLKCEKLASTRIATEIKNCQAALRVAIDPLKKAHLQKKLRIHRQNQSERQYRGVMETIGFLEGYVEKKFNMPNNVTIKTLHVLAELKQGLGATDTSDRRTIVTDTLREAAKSTMSSDTYSPAATTRAPINNFGPAMYADCVVLLGLVLGLVLGSGLSLHDVIVLISTAMAACSLVRSPVQG